MKGLIPRLKMFGEKHGSLILTCAGAAGVIATAVIAVKETPKAMALLERKQEEKGEKLTTLEKIKIAGPAYIPAALVGAGTIGCIFGAHGLNKRQQAALVGLYTLADGAYKEYKNKVTELYGEEADRKIKYAISNDHYMNDDIRPRVADKQRFMDFNSLQIFDATKEDILDAEITLNKLLQSRGFVWLNEYHELLGLPSIDTDYQTGWSKALLEENGYDRIEFDYDEVEMENGDIVGIISMLVEPVYQCPF